MRLLKLRTELSGIGINGNRLPYPLNKMERDYGAVSWTSPPRTVDSFDLTANGYVSELFVPAFPCFPSLPDLG
jgi:hypothetical protein